MQGISWLPLFPLMLVLTLSIPSAEQTLSREERVQVVAELAGIDPGHTVADIGAGDGKYSFLLAKLVGAEGKVFATDIERPEIEKIQRKASRRGRRNVETVLGTSHETGLDSNCCDAIFLRHVYHHFEDPEVMVSEFWRVLEAGGRIAIVDFESFRGSKGHGVEPEAVTREMSASGFELQHIRQPWGNQEDGFLLIFLKPRPEAVTGAR